MFSSVKRVLAALLAPVVISTVAVVALATPAAAAPATPIAATATHIAIPVGVWDIRVTRPGASYPGVFTFSRFLGACTADGGLGLWWPTGRDTFSYKMIGKLFGPDGSQVGYIEINQNSTLTGDTYTGSGIHHVYDTSWNVLATVEVVITGVRSSAVSPC